MRGIVSLSGFVAAAVVAAGAPRPAAADGLRFHGSAAAALPATGPQKNEQSWGAQTGAMLELPIVPQLGVGLGVGAVTLSDGEAPSDPQLADADGATGMSGALAVHVRPGATADPTRRRWHSGIWSGSSIGVMRSNGLLRLMSEVSLGYDFALGEGGFAAGPSVGWLHVFQPDDSLRPADANVLSVGLHALFDTARPVVVAEPPPAPAVNADTDADGLPNATDGCPLDAEDHDGFEDDDGCPDADNDADRVLDAFDRCPLDAEDHDGFEDEDGCPDADNDADRIPDAEDRCPHDAEDPDDFEDEDGCPDADNDGDGFEDGSDDCPLEPEVVNGYADEDGCPDEEQVRVVGDRILLDERIHFMTNSAYIRHKSHGLVLRIARLLNQHPEYVHVEVQGHADARGDERFNQRLSERRATAVMDFLIERGGVDASRLHATGYGTSQPLLDAADPGALYMNRRVELRVTRRPRDSERAP